MAFELSIIGTPEIINSEITMFRVKKSINDSMEKFFDDLGISMVMKGWIEDLEPNIQANVSLENRIDCNFIVIFKFHRRVNGTVGGFKTILKPKLLGLHGISPLVVVNNDDTPMEDIIASCLS